MRQQRFKYINEIFKELMIKSTKSYCHAIYFNLQENKNDKCCFFHFIDEKKNVEREIIIQLFCDVKFHFFEFVFDENDTFSTKYMSIVNYEEHNHLSLSS